MKVDMEVEEPRAVRLRIAGMDCPACARAVALELAAVPGVQAVRVDRDVATADLLVEQRHRCDEALAAAVWDAGCELVDLTRPPVAR